MTIIQSWFKRKGKYRGVDKTSEGHYKATITLKGKSVYLFSGTDPKKLAMMRDIYILKNNLDHKLNF